MPPWSLPFGITWFCARRSFASRKWGRIINTAPAHSFVASSFKVAYVSAKHGVARLTKIAVELATFGITRNCISPGYVWTPLVEKQIPDAPRKPAV